MTDAYAKGGSRQRQVVLGIDFDNTLACYDDLFHSLATERQLIDPQTPRTKRAVRDALRRVGRDTEWTQLQAVAYGQRLLEAPAFSAAVETLVELHRAGVVLRIVSHKTRFPALGPRCDLRRSALAWLEHNRVLDPDRTGIGRQQIYFEDSQAAKRGRIRRLGCTHFVDDLREFLLHPSFPGTVARLLFDPSNGDAVADDSVRVVTHWREIRECFMRSGGGDKAAAPRYAFYRSG